MSWDKKKAVEYILANAQAFSTGRCAEYTRKAIEAGGIELSRTADAKNYGPKLTAMDFTVVSDTIPEAGDVVVIDGFEGNSHGHMAMYDGSAWVSDFVQRDLYPGPGYRTHKPQYKVYRHS